ncbi:Rha family transcriptional regulator [Burkholderia pseudomallei]|uniref:Rha family transcriptional regulator n=1 Tax=Burkholderia pseudomallei TaxID=28450 RepID=UPI00015E133F|nr:Rha family transcriptional regulator [Burkholderia pseudomallei]AIP70170.1 phage regulatory Rha family protein [Burkholderia pseudomallei]AJW92660.1 phage regulatory Rha family protein [Burkholderia pseudomallei 406e]AYX07591.1 hypothetical protein EGY14_28770 [Burkholderia pseudomallei]EDO86010.1 conserved hypothetical protein [Burkholderia pseudomallei 406e]CAJ3954880.1 Uncharacterized phage-encoded protein [Burkholderia pseudomallei]
MADNSDVFQDIVTLGGDRLVTDSRRVAMAFGKRHDNVLRDIHAMRDSGVPSAWSMKAELRRRGPEC